MISILIPSKNEPYLEQTVKDIKDNARTDVEVLVGDDEIEQLGQRALTNKLAKQAKYEYILKTDGHCSFGPGFDKILLEDMDKKTVLAPLLLALDAERWEVSHHNKMANFVFNDELVMHHAPTEQGMLVETMCLQGSCFLVHQDFYWDANLCDESLGSWGSQGIELGIKAWYNNGKCLTSKKTYYGHLFRHGEKDFPYKRDQGQIDQTYNKFKEQFLDNRLGWLVDKFNYPCGWTKAKVEALCNNQSTK